MSKKKYTFIDLFAGCGGLSLGLEQAGFTPCFVNEIVETYCNTYKNTKAVQPAVLPTIVGPLPFREPMPPCCTALVFLCQEIRLVVVAVIVDC